MLLLAYSLATRVLVEIGADLVKAAFIGPRPRP